MHIMARKYSNRRHEKPYTENDSLDGISDLTPWRILRLTRWGHHLTGSGVRFPWFRNVSEECNACR